MSYLINIINGLTGACGFMIAALLWHRYFLIGVYWSLALVGACLYMAIRSDDE